MPPVRKPAKAKKAPTPPKPKVRSVVRKEIVVPVLETVGRYAGERSKANGQTLYAEQESGRLTLRTSKDGQGWVIADTALGELVDILAADVATGAK